MHHVTFKHSVPPMTLPEDACGFIASIHMHMFTGTCIIIHRAVECKQTITTTECLCEIQMKAYLCAAVAEGVEACQ